VESTDDPVKRFLLVVVSMVFLCAAIFHIESETWSGVWLLLFVCMGIPVTLLTIRDLLSSRRFCGRFRRPLLLHVCAAFGVFVGWCMTLMVDAGVPNADRLYWFAMLSCPCLVCATPFFLFLHGAIPLSELKSYYIGEPVGREDRGA
jgi:hypothetical protein